MRKVLRGILFFIFFLQIAAQAQFVLNNSDGLPDLGRSSAVWADFNNDGKPDVAISGINDVGVKEAGIYFNNGSGIFSNSGAGLTAVSDGAMAVNDYDHDGLIDLLMTGVDATNTKITKIYRNEGGGVFLVLPFLFDGVANGAVAFTDLTNDGRADVLINGLDNSNRGISSLYINTGNGNFTLKETPMAGSSYGGILVFDFNNDSFQDVVVFGLNNNNQRITSLYLNKANGLFVKKETILPMLRSGGMAFGDVDNDGYLDLFISGNAGGSITQSVVYRNNSGHGFTIVKTLEGIAEGSGAWGDYDHDGLTDLATFGFGSMLTASVLKNTNGNDLTNSGFPLPGTSKGQCAWVDYNQDNRLDFFLGGYATLPFSSLYENASGNANTVPLPPANLRYTAYADSVVLSWDAASDEETTSAGLTYAIYVGTSAGAVNVKSPMTHITTGLRKVSSLGEIKGTTAVVQGLPEGIYYWAVQAIDPSFAGSAFSAESTFTSCAPVSIAGSSKACFKSEISFDAGGMNDQVNWYSYPTNNTIGSGRHLAYTLLAKDTIIARVTKPIGCTVTDTVFVSVLSLPSVDAGNDIAACYDESIIIQALTTEPDVVWFEENNEANILSAVAKISIIHTKAMRLVAQVKNNNGCINTDTVTLSLSPQPNVNLGNDQHVCLGTTLAWHAGGGTETTSWFSKTEGLLLQNSFSFESSIKQDDKLWAEVRNTEGCLSADTVAVTVMPLPPASAGLDKMICNDAVPIGLPSGQTGLTYEWTPSSSLSDATISNPNALPTVDTEYVLLVVDENTCRNRDTVMVYYNTPSVINAGRDTVICVGKNVRLGGRPTASGSLVPYTFAWSPEKGLDDPTRPNPVATPNETTTYSLHTFVGECLIDVSAVNITVNDLPDVQTNDDLVVGVDEGVTLSVSGATEYQWFPEEFFADNTVVTPLVLPHRTTRYWVVGKDNNGCYGSDTVKVSVRSELFVPDLFTPNDDGANDIFRAHGSGVKEIHLSVYDRWGRLLFESHDLEKGWDGRMNGNDVESGSYVWTVEGSHFDGSPLMYQGKQRGIVTLMR